MNPSHHYRYSVTARDPATGREQTRLITYEITAAPPWAVANLLVQITNAIARGWHSRYYAPFPTDRIEWTATPIPDPRRPAA